MLIYKNIINRLKGHAKQYIKNSHFLLTVVLKIAITKNKKPDNRTTVKTIIDIV